MDAERNETSEAVEPVGLTVKWSPDDMRGIQRAAEVLSAREHGDFNRTDIIRMGTRRFVAEVLGAEVAA